MLDVQQQMLIEQRISNQKPSVGVAYILAIFLGLFGAHRFYLGRGGSAVVMLLLTITFFGIIVSGIWNLVDLFLIPGMIREDVQKLRQTITLEVMSTTSGQSTAPSAGPPQSAVVGATS